MYGADLDEGAAAQLDRFQLPIADQRIDSGAADAESLGGAVD